MKKFLIFLVSLVVVVCVGLTTYYFMRNNEIITIKTKEIYCNAGDTIPLKSLGISLEKANVSKKTTFDYNAGGEDVTKYIKYDAESDAYIVSQENAGEVTLVIRTSNKKYADFTINVHIGNGTVENPYYIFNESDLMKIGSTYRLDKSYILMNDVTLTSNFKPIGFNSNTETWDGFNGTFNGNGHSIKGLNLTDVDALNVGFFSSIGATGKVQNLCFENANISGAYENAGVLAGVINGNIEKVAIKNATITNNLSNSATGSVVGTLTGNAKLTYAENVEINVSGTEENVLDNVSIGGLVGEVNQSIVQACYANNVEINSINSTGVAIGGLVGVLTIGTQTGSIQQSYANTICSHEYFGAFIGHILPSQDFDIEKANMLRHLIGNIAVVYGVENSSQITDGKLVHGVVADFFVNSTYVDRSAFFDKESALYLIRGYASAGDVISTNEYVYYAIDMNTITSWDTTYVWDTTKNTLPTLRMGSIYPADPTGEYFRRNLDQKDLGNTETFISVFSKDIENESVKLLEDIDLSQDWTPVAVKNSTIDGNYKTITINLNKAVDGNLGLFTTIDNSTIKNLNIIVTGVSANSTNAGAVAGVITSSDEMTTSTIENVTITYQNFATPVITNFGGVAGTIENTTINNCSVSGLNIGSDAQIENAGGVVGVINNNGVLSNSNNITAQVYATVNAGGFVAINNGTINDVSGNVVVKYAKASELANVGGAVAINNSVINNVAIASSVEIENAGTEINVGGLVGSNNGTITKSYIYGGNVVLNETNSKAKVGGVAGVNDGIIEQVENNLSQLGSYYVGKNYYVGGVSAINNGTISQVLTQSNLNGNYVAGVVVEMKNSSASVDQVVVGIYNNETKVLSQNTIKGDKYVAGVVVDFQAGNMSNIQASSNISGETNSTRSSLVALVFAYGTSLKNATIDNSFSGYGERYREVWTDFATYNNKAEFGFENGDTYDRRFNLYFQDVHHGSMQSVVINGARSGVDGAKASMGGAFAFTVDYQDTAESSYIKVVNGFNDVSQFQGSFTFVCAKSSLFGIEHKADKDLTFQLGSVWESNNGISLIFVNNL